LARRASFKAIQRQIQMLQEKAEALKEREKGPALKEIVSLMQEHGIELSELRGALNGHAGARRGRPPGKKRGRPSKLRGKKVKPLYRNPKSGETWSGRGRPARWIAAAEKAGHKRQEFLIKR
jgi:DNA-binding protein H-NS